MQYPVIKGSLDLSIETQPIEVVFSPLYRMLVLEQIAPVTSLTFDMITYICCVEICMAGKEVCQGRPRNWRSLGKGSNQN